jgi:murein DD-endopeptidase MepM/ murein hydrolase activator NlpD
MEHWAGNLQSMGDALGSDCHIQKLVSVRGRTFMKSYNGTGRKNEDWYGWGKEVLSPCNCSVVEIRTNPVSNKPGILGKPPAASIRLRTDDGTMFVLAHIANARVTVGEIVRAGQVIASVGNNGYARMPHIHIGAWKDNVPLQVRFDLVEMGKLLAK